MSFESVPPNTALEPTASVPCVFDDFGFFTHIVSSQTVVSARRGSALDR
jgi:hypothetical protein